MSLPASLEQRILFALLELSFKLLEELVKRLIIFAGLRSREENLECKLMIFQF